MISRKKILSRSCDALFDECQHTTMDEEDGNTWFDKHHLYKVSNIHVYINNYHRNIRSIT